MKKQSGYTLVEIIVVVAIVAIIAAISVAQFVAQKKGSTIQNTAEQLALNIRKAQSQAMAVHPTGTGVGAYKNGYGIYLNLLGGGGEQNTDNKSYILFVDFEATPGAGGWDRSYKKNMAITACGNPSSLSNGDECQQKFSFGTDDYISKIETCDVNSSGCSNLGNNVLAITFLRPNLDAYFCTSPPSGCPSAVPQGHINIEITSPIGTKKIVSVWSTGQISIQ